MTAEEILEMAYGRLGDVTPEEIASGPELLNFLNRALAGLFAFGATINPVFFGKQSAAVAHDGSGWPRPVDADSIFRVELTTGVEVIVVPFDDRAIETSQPAIYELGQKFYTAGNLLDPTPVDSLYFYHSKRPTLVAIVTDLLDTMWPEAFNELLALEVAIYVAMKNDTTMDLETLKALRNEWAQRFASFLQRATLNVTRRRSVARLGLSHAMPLLAGNA